MAVQSTRLQRRTLSVALMSALLVAGNAAMAQEAPQNSDDKPTELDKVVVTGSLIPQTKLETFTPVTVISAEDIKVRGFTSVSDAIQQSSFATGGIQGAQTSASFTQGAETVSLFGLSVSYTKYLIDGRPMADYPALYNGSDAFNNISGIPIDLVERIEILPGGQSSLYGSDAIAGVINIILKKNIEAPVISIRGGTYSEGGGDSGRISAAKGFSFADNRFNLLLGAQYENKEAIWAFDRDLTKEYNRNGTSAPLAGRDWLVYSPFTSYHFLDPANCSNVDSGFNGTEGLQFRAGFGDGFYCGSLQSPGYRTLANSKEAFQAYTHGTFDISDNHQLYGDLLYSDEEVGYHIGSNYTWWGTSVEWGYFFDPNAGTALRDIYGPLICDGAADVDACIASLPAGDLMNLQRAFVPEDMGPGGFENSMSFDKSKSFAATVGLRGTFGASNWDYDASLSRTDYKLTEKSFARFADPINQWFLDHVLNPSGAPVELDPYFGAYPVFTPDYAAFYQLLTPEDFRSFTGYTNSQSKTENTLGRFQATNGSLFSLPGGDAGLAVAAEAARESWDYNPDPLLMNGGIWGTTAVDGEGQRDRYAAIAELRLPVLESLTASLSGRYDDFRPDGAESVNKTTYSVGVEFRPVESLLFRGKYGTAFKAPTLADQFQSVSGYYSFVTDYYRCNQLGFDPTEIDNCPAAFSSRQYFGETEGNKDLEPLTADVWNAGVVWAPTNAFSISADYYHWDIRNEVAPQNADGLALREMYCRTGAPGYDINSPVCVDALSKIQRNNAGNIVYIYTPKVNEAREVLNAVSATASYMVNVGNFGNLLFRGSYTNSLKHEFWQFEGDEVIDLMRRPGWSSDPKSKANASVTWSKNDWSTTLYANYIGHTPNNRARSLDSYDDPNGAASINDGRVYAGKLRPFTLYNLSVNFKPTDKLDLSFMVNNLFNQMPPEDVTYPGSSGAPYNSAQYSVYGRALYVEARYTFGK